MIKIKLITVGKIKEAFYRDAVAEYSKRLSRYSKLEIIEVADEMTPDSASETEENEIKRKEAERILSKVKDTEYVCTLEIGGKKMTSVDFAGWFETRQVKGDSCISFIIGGSLGLHESVIKRSDFHLSFSDMTFPHQLMRVILLEQVYRAFRINANEPYHK